ncbi:hypothetical protein EVAR_5438_1 [Eumeta japonica]|uniref:Integrin beta N-terminal domain-containing protein n=1 Tax=Eumeta variegata TaxID=151549 RepID=A0A4C1TC12_EUMVA|nr:hypothetical protein EVAR_5438_1 [Eumeta japonica]
MRRYERCGYLEKWEFTKMSAQDVTSFGRLLLASFRPQLRALNTTSNENPNAELDDLIHVRVGGALSRTGGPPTANDETDTMVRKRTQWSVAVVLVCVFAGACWSQLAERLMTPNSCSGKSSCSDCIRTAGCHWCSAPDHSRPRCFLPDVKDGNDYCSEEFITNSGNLISIDQSRSLTRGKGGGRIGWGSEESMSISETSSYEASGSVSSSGAAGGAFGAAEDLVQIKPQRVRLQLRMMFNVNSVIYLLLVSNDTPGEFEKLIIEE